MKILQFPNSFSNEKRPCALFIACLLALPFAMIIFTVKPLKMVVNIDDFHFPFDCLWEKKNGLEKTFFNDIVDDDDY